MAKQPEDPSKYVSQIKLVGGRTNLVKSLPGFKKQHHTIPDAVNPATTAFLGKLCAADLGTEGEEYFRRAKTIFGYKRTEISLGLASPLATLASQDFTFEIEYSLEPADAGRYKVSYILHSLPAESIQGATRFEELFAALFTGIVFDLAKGVKVEAVIDAIEDRDGENGMSVDYPSDCRHCTIRVKGVAAEVICDGAILEMRFPRAGSPGELVKAFSEVRTAFLLTKNRVLSGLL